MIIENVIIVDDDELSICVIETLLSTGTLSSAAYKSFQNLNEALVSTRYLNPANTLMLFDTNLEEGNAIDSLSELKVSEKNFVEKSLVILLIDGNDVLRGHLNRVEGVVDIFVDKCELEELFRSQLLMDPGIQKQYNKDLYIQSFSLFIANLTSNWQDLKKEPIGGSLRHKMIGAAKMLGISILINFFQIENLDELDAEFEELIHQLKKQRDLMLEK